MEGGCAESISHSYRNGVAWQTCDVIAEKVEAETWVLRADNSGATSTTGTGMRKSEMRSKVDHESIT